MDESGPILAQQKKGRQESAPEQVIFEWRIGDSNP